MKVHERTRNYDKLPRHAERFMTRRVYQTWRHFRKVEPDGANATAVDKNFGCHDFAMPEMEIQCRVMYKCRLIEAIIDEPCNLKQGMQIVCVSDKWLLFR
ncbi:hypothetical protein WA026_011330 [Henosepilachna vigintioctopunctata]|uniref:Uncharacterized protein n=1 Tax=Henosepilachna vigintioctopunctata TaxID=420089 RepID=A0AAW1U6A7_9CUCU